MRWLRLTGAAVVSVAIVTAAASATSSPDKRHLPSVSGRPAGTGAASASSATAPSPPATTTTTVATGTVSASSAPPTSPTAPATTTRSVATSTVSASSAPVTRHDVPTTANPSGAAMPVGDSEGWHQVYAENFTTNSATFPAGGYANNWIAYAKGNDTTRRGAYSTAGLSVHNGMLDIHLRSLNGVPQVAAPVAMRPSGVAYRGSLYGRYTIRFRADNLFGYKTAWMLWPDDNNKQDGEIDFPEGDLSGRIAAFNHVVGNHNALATAVVTTATYQTWHTATILWLPSGVSFYLDGKFLGQSANSPSVPMHWVLQTETSTYGHVPSARENGHVYVDWATIYVPTVSLLR